MQVDCQDILSSSLMQVVLTTSTKSADTIYISSQFSSNYFRINVVYTKRIFLSQTGINCLSPCPYLLSNSCLVFAPKRVIMRGRFKPNQYHIFVKNLSIIHHMEECLKRRGHCFVLNEKFLQKYEKTKLSIYSIKLV